MQKKIKEKFLLVGLKSKNTRVLLTIFVLVTTLAIVYQTTSAIYQDKELTLQGERENGLVVVRLLEEHANQQIATAATRLNDVAEAIKTTPKHIFKDEKTIHEVIEDVFTNEGSSSSLLYVNPRGQRWTSPRYFPYFVFTTEPRPYINALIKQPNRERILVGQVMRRFVDSDMVLPVARNIYSPDGRYIGLISIDVSLGYFNKVYSSVALKNIATVSLLSNSGQIIVDSNEIDLSKELGEKSAPVPQNLDSLPAEGHFKARQDSSNNLDVLYTYRKLKSFPLTMLYGREVEVMLGNWYERSKDRVIFSLVFIFLHIVLTSYLLRHMLKLENSEARLKASELRFTDLFQYSPVPLAMLNMKRDCLIEVNSAFVALSGLPRSSLIGKSPNELKFWESPATRDQYVRALLRDGYVSEFEATLRRASGESRICKISARMIEVDGEKMVVFSTVDITSARESEHRILKLNGELEQRVLERTLKMQTALDSVTKLQAQLARTEKLMALGALVTGVSHELNTPLGNCVTTSSALEAYTRSLATELLSDRPRRSIMSDSVQKIVEGTEIMNRNLTRAVELISMFRQVSAEQTEHQRAYFELERLIRENTLSLLNVSTHDVLVTYDLESAIHLESYPDALSQVFDQLVDNTVKHAFTELCEKKILITSRMIDAEYVEIVYQDSGCGVRPEYINRIFEPFFTTKFGQGSNGLGMHIVYNLVTGPLNGKITLSNPPTTGLCVVIVLPISAV